MGQRSSTEYSFGLTDAFYPCPDIGGAACLSVRASHAGKSNDRMISFHLHRVDEGLIFSARGYYRPLIGR